MAADSSTTGGAAYTIGYLVNGYNGMVRHLWGAGVLVGLRGVPGLAGEPPLGGVMRAQVIPSVVPHTGGWGALVEVDKGGRGCEAVRGCVNM